MKSLLVGPALGSGVVVAMPLLLFAPTVAPTPVTPPVADARAAGGGSGSPTATSMAPVFADVPPGGYPDPFPAGECTWWAAYNHRVTWTGDAWQWLVNAAAQGHPTSPTPTVGAIAVYGRARGYDSRFGHVALVIAVGQGTYTISEMNFIGHGKVDSRQIAWPDTHVVGFIP